MFGKKGVDPCERRRPGKRCTSPVEQAEQACFVLNKMLAQDPDLANGSGDIGFPYRYAGILPYPGPDVHLLAGKILGEEYDPRP